MSSNRNTSDGSQGQHQEESSQSERIEAFKKHPKSKCGVGDKGNNALKEHYDWYGEYRKLYGVSYQIRLQMQAQLAQKDNIMRKLQIFQEKLQNIQANLQTSNPNPNRRSRRNAHQIDRVHCCSVETCRKEYGSEGSLIQHIKLKHPQIYHSKI